MNEIGDKASRRMRCKVLVLSCTSESNLKSFLNITWASSIEIRQLTIATGMVSSCCFEIMFLEQIPSKVCQSSHESISDVFTIHAK